MVGEKGGQISLLAVSILGLSPGHESHQMQKLLAPSA